LGSVAWKRAIKCWISWVLGEPDLGRGLLMGLGLFFYADIQVGAGLLDDLLSRIARVSC